MNKKSQPILVDQPNSAGLSNRIRVERVATGFQFTEGPAWHSAGHLLFSDTPANCIYSLRENGDVSVAIERSGLSHGDTSDLSDMIGSNGLAFDAQGDLYICQHGNHAVARLSTTGPVQPLTTGFSGRPFNSPNDLLIHSNGTVFFTDPPYGLKNQVLNRRQYQPVAGVYGYFNGATGLLSDAFQFPNGLCFTHGEKFLFVSSNHPDEPFLRRFQLNAAGNFVSEIIFKEQNADGMTSDREGNLFLCTDEGVLIVSPEGKTITNIVLPEMPSNIAWGGDQRDCLFVTARSSVYRITGVCWS